MTQLTKTTPRHSRRRPTRFHAHGRRPLRARQQPQGPLGGLAKFATGLLSSPDKRGGSKKGPVALALGAGAAGIAVLRRRRSAGAERQKSEDTSPTASGTREDESKGAHE
jgi:hypothetical protein